MKGRKLTANELTQLYFTQMGYDKTLDVCLNYMGEHNYELLRMFLREHMELGELTPQDLDMVTFEIQDVMETFPEVFPNIGGRRVVKSLVLQTDEFDRILKNIFGEDFTSEYSLDGIWMGYADGDRWVDLDEIYGKLASYFGVAQVTSIHADDCDDIGVWISFV